MKHLALVLAAAVLGTGCIVTSDNPPPAYGSVDLYWDFVRSTPGVGGGYVVYDSTLVGVDGRCLQSDVDTVTVDAPGVAQVNVPCIYGGIQGVTIDGVFAGVSSFRVRGWRGAIAVYDDTFALDVPASPAAPASYTVDVAAVSAPIDMFAYLSDGTNYYTTCSSAGYPTIYYDVYDSYATHILSSSASCSGGSAYPLTVLLGDLDLDNYTIRMKGYQGSTRTFDSCLSNTAKMLSFDHFVSQTGAGGLFVDLFAPPACTL